MMQPRSGPGQGSSSSSSLPSGDAVASSSALDAALAAAAAAGTGMQASGATGGTDIKLPGGLTLDRAAAGGGGPAATRSLVSAVLNNNRLQQQQQHQPFGDGGGASPATETTATSNEMLLNFVRAEEERRKILQLLELQQIQQQQRQDQQRRHDQQQQIALLAAAGISADSIRDAGLLNQSLHQQQQQKQQESINSELRALASLNNSNLAGLAFGGQGAAAALAFNRPGILGSLSASAAGAAGSIDHHLSSHGMSSATNGFGLMDLVNMTNTQTSASAPSNRTTNLEQLLLEQQILNRLRTQAASQASSATDKTALNQQLQLLLQAQASSPNPSSSEVQHHPVGPPGSNTQTTASPLKEKRKGRTGSFPQKLHQMLSDLEKQDGGTDIASFLPNGRAFIIRKPKVFEETVMPKYFRMSHFSSFQRQLNLYAFRRVTEGPQKGCYYHDLFSRDNVALVGQIRRMKNRPDTTLATAASMNSQHVSSGLSPSPATSSRSTVLDAIGDISGSVRPMQDASTASVTAVAAAATQQSLSGVAGLGLLSQLGAIGLAPNALGSLSSSSLGLLSSLSPGSILPLAQNPEAITGKTIGDLRKTPGMTKHDPDSNDDDGDGDDE